MTAPTQVPPVLPLLRFRGRHVQQTIEAYIKDQMDQLGWVNAPVNMGGTPMTFIEFPPDLTGTSVPVAPNTVAITFGDEPDELDEQLGGGLYTVTYPLFVDIYGESYSGSRSIAIDIKDILTRKYLQVYSFNTDPPVAVEGAWIEMENVTGPRTPSGSINAEGFRKYWRVVTGQVQATFSDLPPGPGVVYPVTSLNPPADYSAEAPFIDSTSGSVTFDISGYTGGEGNDLIGGSGDTTKTAYVQLYTVTGGPVHFDTAGSDGDVFLWSTGGSGSGTNTLDFTATPNSSEVLRINPYPGTVMVTLNWSVPDYAVP